MAVIRAHQDQLIATQTQQMPPEHDMLGPSEPIDPSYEAPPVEQTVPHEETTIVEIETSI